MTLLPLVIIANIPKTLRFGKVRTFRELVTAME